MNATDSPARTWEEAAEKESRLVLAEYRDRLQRASVTTVDEALDKRFDELKSAVENDDSTWARIEFRHLASVALVGYVAASNARVKDAMDKVVTTIAAKQHDYGYDNIAGFGSQGLVVRISDKRARLKNLVKRGAPANEPLLDTWLDIVGYCIVGLMWEAGTFSLPLAADRDKELPPWAFDDNGNELPDGTAFDRADLAQIREIVEDTVIGGNDCNAWLLAALSKREQPIAESVAKHAEHALRKIAEEKFKAMLEANATYEVERARDIAREEIEKWQQRQAAQNAQTIQDTIRNRPPNVTAPDLLGRDHLAPRSQ